MVNTKIYIQKQPLDVYDDVAAEFTYSIDDVKDFASRNTSFSKTIVIPGTANNNKLFGHVFEFASSNPYDPLKENVGVNFNAAIAADCLILIDNVQIFKGVLRLLQINIDRGTIEYECAVFGELGGFANTIGNKRLEDLDFSEYNHDWTFANITNSWNTINGSGYYYPLIDYGKVSTNKKDWQYKALRPAYYVREVIDKIITAAGYTYTSEFLDTAIARRLIIPQNNKEMRQKSNVSLEAEAIADEYADDRAILWTPTTLGDFTYVAGTFTYNNATPFTTDISISTNGIVNDINVLYPYIQLQVFKNGTLIAFETYDLTTVPESYAFSIVINNITFNQNDTLQIRQSANSTSWTVDAGVLTLLSTNPEQLIAVNYGDMIQMNQHIPKGIFQREFITSIVKMFNLYIFEDSVKSKHLIIEAGSQFYERGEDVLLAVNDFGDLLEVEVGGVNLIVEPGESAYLDWTYKVDRAKPMTLRPMSELNGRYFEYKYKPDGDYYNEQYQKKYEQGYADRIVDTGFAFANDKQTAELIFSATPLVGYDGEYKVYPTIVKLSNVGTANQVEDATEHNIRILQAKKMTSAPSWIVYDGATVRGTTTNWGYAGNLDDPKNPSSDINFAPPQELNYNLPAGIEYPLTNLFTAFWFDYVSEITNKDSKLLTCYLKLTQQDIFNLNFARLIYIDGALWRLNKIVDFNTIDTTKCEFLRVLETTYE